MPVQLSRAPRLLAISRGQVGPSSTVGDWAGVLSKSGLDLAIQIREKDLSDAQLLELLARVRKGFQGLLLTNGRADIAVGAGADGVHLPAAGLSAQVIRKTFGPKIVIGVSTHSAPEVERARDDGADYVTFGPVFDTPSKRSFGSPVGLDALATACRVGLPTLALGGMTLPRISDALSAGAWGIAGIRLFQGTASLEHLRLHFD